MRPDSAKNHVGTSSAFRAKRRTNRIHEAHAIIAEREEEIAALLAALENAADMKTRRMLTQRLQGAKNNLTAWQRYVAQGSPREPRAVMGARRTRA